MGYVIGKRFLYVNMSRISIILNFPFMTRVTKTIATTKSKSPAKITKTKKSDNIMKPNTHESWGEKIEPTDLSHDTKLVVSGGSKVVIVEAPTKAKSIQHYLGAGYSVFATYGHLRHLVPKAGSIDVDHDFEATWEKTIQSKKSLPPIMKALQNASELILATDPDKEGEAISWHLLEILNEEKKLKKGIKISRVIMDAITKDRIRAAFAIPTELKMSLVHAYRARNCLDYLVGFFLSPVLWRKLPNARSAGRVQSVVLRSIVERDQEITRFVPEDYFSVSVLLEICVNNIKKPSMTPTEQFFEKLMTQVVRWKEKNVTQRLLSDKNTAQEICDFINGHHHYKIQDIQEKTMQQKTYPPFYTSTLQQTASAKLGFSPNYTMKLAQQLYEGISLGAENIGLITYMRTDSVKMDPQAIVTCREQILDKFGEKYLPEKSMMYTTKSKNAQEAHEAIRPTLFHEPHEIQSYLNRDQYRLYTLIWARTLASQMKNAIFLQKKIVFCLYQKDTKDEVEDIISLHANNRTMVFDGYLRAYNILFSDKKQPDQDAGHLFDNLSVGNIAHVVKFLKDNFKNIQHHENAEDFTEAQDDTDDDEKNMGKMMDNPQLNAHQTQPPSYFNDASLIKHIEDLGVGRPSTYATIVPLLIERAYIRKDGKKLTSTWKGRVVTYFLIQYFSLYVDPAFTASMEEGLDLIEQEKKAWVPCVRDFWLPFHTKVQDALTLNPVDVCSEIQKQMNQCFLPSQKCPQCQAHDLMLRVGKFGPYLSCQSYPDCRYVKPLTDEVNPGDIEAIGTETQNNGERVLGHDTDLNQDILLKKGPFGFYFEWKGQGAVVKDGEADEAPVATKKKTKSVKAAEKPMRVSCPKDLDPSDMTLEWAKKLKMFPFVPGPHPDTGVMLKIGLSTLAKGPYVFDGIRYSSLNVTDSAEWDALRLMPVETLLSMITKKATEGGVKTAGPKKFKKMFKKTTVMTKPRRTVGVAARN